MLTTILCRKVRSPLEISKSYDDVDWVETGYSGWGKIQILYTMYLYTYMHKYT